MENNKTGKKDSIIKPISGEMNDSTKQYLEMLKWYNKYFDELSKSLYIPKEKFNN